MLRDVFLSFLIFTLSTVITVSSSYGQDNRKQADEVIQQLMAMDYQRADSLIRKLPPDTMTNYLADLSRIMATAGQKEISFQPAIDSTVTPLLIIGLIRNGYYRLHQDPFSDQSFRLFNRAYDLAKNSSWIQARKLALLSILEVYNQEFIQANSDQESFLNEWKSLVSDSVDQFHLYRNLVLYDFRGVDLQSETSDLFFSDFDKLMKSFKENRAFMARYYSLKGVFMEVKRSWNESMKFHKMAVELIEKDDFHLRSIKFRSLIKLAELHRQAKHYDSAAYFLEKTRDNLDMADTLRSDFYYYYYSSLNLSDRGDYKKANDFLYKATELRNQMDYQRNAYEVAELNRLYQVQQKELALLKEKDKVKTQYYLIIGIFSLLLFISIVYYLIQRDLRRKKLLAEKERNVEREKLSSVLKEQELANIDSMIAGQEKERQRIAEDLHDDLGGLMAAIKMHFSSFKADIGDGYGESFNKAHELLGVAYDRVRSIAHEKNAGMMATEGLLKSLENMATKTSISHKLQINVQHHGLDRRFENSLELSLFRVIQELVTNVIKHANANEINIHITNHEESLNIMVEDNGEGFDPSGITLREDGMGLKNIDKRVTSLQGRMEIDSEVGSGTTVIINVPLKD